VEPRQPRQSRRRAGSTKEHLKTIRVTELQDGPVAKRQNSARQNVIATRRATLFRTTPPHLSVG
jgi:hypothetical protein